MCKELTSFKEEFKSENKKLNEEIEIIKKDFEKLRGDGIRVKNELENQITLAKVSDSRIVAIENGLKSVSEKFESTNKSRIADIDSIKETISKKLANSTPQSIHEEKTKTSSHHSHERRSSTKRNSTIELSPEKKSEETPKNNLNVNDIPDHKKLFDSNKAKLANQNKRASLFIMEPASIMQNFAANNKAVKRVQQNGNIYVVNVENNLQEGMGYSITVSLTNGSKSFPAELLTKELMKTIMNMISYQDIMPYQVSIKTIDSFSIFVKWFLLPFININENGGKIEIWPKAQGIFGCSKVNFLGESLFMFVHYIQNKSFRIILSSSNSSNETIKIELEFDDITVKRYFEDLCYYDVKSESDEILEHLEERNSETKFSNSRVSYCSNYSVKDQNEFKELLQNVINEFSDMLEDFKPKMPSIKFDSCSKWFFKAKIFSEWSRIRLSVIIDTSVNSEFEIFLKNAYETHASGSEKVKSKGFTYMKYDKVQKMFGVLCLGLDKNERNSISNLISECFSIKCYEKELEDCDNYGHEENSIIPVNPDVCSYYRSIIVSKDGSEIRSPLTLSMLSINGEPIGVKVVTYCPLKQREKGAFFHVNLEFWRKWASKESAPKRKKKYLVNFPANENFNLTPILDKGGWHKVIGALKWEEKTDTPTIAGVEINSSHPVVLIPLESVLNLEKFA